MEENTVEDNGIGQEAAGIRVEGETRDLVFLKNRIRETRSGAAAKQTTGIMLREKVGRVAMEENQIEVAKPVDDRRSSK